MRNPVSTNWENYGQGMAATVAHGVWYVDELYARSAKHTDEYITVLTRDNLITKSD